MTFGFDGHQQLSVIACGAKATDLSAPSISIIPHG